MNQPDKGGISRRQFARRAALLSATATIAPAASVFAEPASTPSQEPPAAHPNLSPESQAEADARLQQIFTQYGTRFTDDDKKLLRQLNGATQESLDHIRAYPLANGDSPALYLKPLVEREKKKSESPAATPAKKS